MEQQTVSRTKPYQPFTVQFTFAAWATMLICLALPLLMSAKVGGAPLLLSMSNFKIRPDDSPKMWIRQLRDRVK